MAKKKKVYVCQICNTYFPKDADEAVPVCCGKEMVVMDEFEEDEVKKYEREFRRTLKKGGKYNDNKDRIKRICMPAVWIYL